MNRNKIFVLIICVSLATESVSQEMNLTQILEKIEKDNPMLTGYRTKAEALNAYAEGATAWMAPMAGFGTFMTPYPSRMAADGNENFENPGSLMISVEQSIPNKNKLQANRRYLSEKSKSEEYRRARQWNELRFAARQAYYSWSVAIEKLKELDTTEKIIQLMETSAINRLALNQGTASSVFRVQARLAEIRNMRSMIESTIEENRIMLTTLMNLPVETSLSISPGVAPTDLVIASDTVAIASRRSDIQGIDQEIRLMRLNQQLQSLQNKPDLRLRFDHMQTYSDMPDQFTAMAMFTIPIAPWSSKMYKAEIAGMNKEIESMKQERTALLLESRGMLSRMEIQISNMRKQLNRYEQEILPALQRNYESLRISWEENREQLPMVLDGLEAMTMARQEYLEKKESLYLMIASYEKLLEQ